jgi:hypothetical protein
MGLDSQHHVPVALPPEERISTHCRRWSGTQGRFRREQRRGNLTFPHRSLKPEPSSHHTRVLVVHSHSGFNNLCSPLANNVKLLSLIYFPNYVLRSYEFVQTLDKIIARMWIFGGDFRPVVIFSIPSYFSY